MFLSVAHFLSRQIGAVSPQKNRAANIVTLLFCFIICKELSLRWYLSADDYFTTPCFCISALRASYDTSMPMRTLYDFLEIFELAFVGTRLLTITYFV